MSDHECIEASIKCNKEKLKELQEKRTSKPSWNYKYWINKNDATVLLLMKIIEKLSTWQDKT